MYSPTLEDVYQQIVDRAQDAIIFADREGVIRFWNAGAESIFWHGAEEAVGKTLDLIVPEKLRERHWAGFRRVIEGGESRYGSRLLSVPALRKDGSRISLEFTITVIDDESGHIAGVAAIIRDVTERRLEEKALKEKLSALENSPRS